MAIHPVIMAGGSGTRFWPLSRRTRPKQFLPLTSPKPLLVDTLERLSPLTKPEDAFVVCGPVHAEPVRAMLPALPASQLLVEPVARNTAPAIGLAALHVHARDPEGVLLVLPSDHHIDDTARFRETLSAAAALAGEGFLTTIGITPTRPETGFGYIHTGAPLGTRVGLQATRVRRFVEKPDYDRAKSYLESGDYLWNAGIFALRADVILEETRRHLPRLHKALETLRPTLGTSRYAATLEEVFPTTEATSIDYGIMEQATDIACVPGDFGWSDVGSFAALSEVRPVDAQGNVSDAGNVLVDSRGCVVLSGDKPVVVVGATDLVVVDTGDTLLVVPKSRAQEVRKAVEALEKRGLGHLL